MRNYLFLVTLVMLFVTPAPVEAGSVYKWVDKDGNVHYTNTPPPEASQQERTVLDERGNVTDTLAAPKTLEELEAERKIEAKRLEAEQLAKDQAAKDNMLLQTYTSAEEMELARDGRLAALEAQVKVVSGTISSLDAQLAELERQAKHFSENGKPVPEPVRKRIEKTRAELLQNQKFLLAREAEQEEIREKFGADIERFKKLKGVAKQAGRR